MTKNICIFAKSKSGTPLYISGLESTSAQHSPKKVRFVFTTIRVSFPREHGINDTAQKRRVLFEFSFSLILWVNKMLVGRHESAIFT